jgi:hypothetical protein
MFFEIIPECLNLIFSTLKRVQTHTMKIYIEATKNYNMPPPPQLALRSVRPRILALRWVAF